jgi:hypothetical protein
MEIDFLYQLAHRHLMHMDDPWRCDFCDSGCNCDQINLEGLAEDNTSLFPDKTLPEVILLIQDKYFDIS